MDRHDDDLSTRDIAGAPATAETEAETRPPEAGAETSQPASIADRGDAAGAETGSGPLLSDTDQTDFQSRWAEIQTRFVDDPRSAVEEADALVAALMKRIADGFAEERRRLESVWDSGEDVGTEDLRVALQRYREFFHRLLST